MTISKHAVYGSDREQVLQDLYSNVETLQTFVAKQKEELLSSVVHFDKLDTANTEAVLDITLAETAVQSIRILVLAEINGGYQYPDRDHDDDGDEENDAEGDPAELGRMRRATFGSHHKENRVYDWEASPPNSVEVDDAERLVEVEQQYAGVALPRFQNRITGRPWTGDRK